MKKRDTRESMEMKKSDTRATFFLVNNDFLVNNADVFKNRRVLVIYRNSDDTIKLFPCTRVGLSEDFRL